MHEAEGFASLVSHREMGRLFKISSAAYYIVGNLGYLLLVCIIKRGNMEFHTPSSGREKMTPDTHSPIPAQAPLTPTHIRAEKGPLFKVQM